MDFAKNTTAVKSLLLKLCVQNYKKYIIWKSIDCKKGSKNPYFLRMPYFPFTKKISDSSLIRFLYVSLR